MHLFYPKISTYSKKHKPIAGLTTAIPKEVFDKGYKKTKLKIKWERKMTLLWILVRGFVALDADAYKINKKKHRPHHGAPLTILP